MSKKKMIETTGQARADCKPDLARITLTLAGRDADLAAASEKLCKSMDAAVDRLEKSGYKREDIEGGLLWAEGADALRYSLSLTIKYSLGKLRGLLQTIGVSLADCNVRVELLLSDPAARLAGVRELALQEARTLADGQAGEEGMTGTLQLVTYADSGEPAPVLICDAPSECYRHGSIPFGAGGYKVSLWATAKCTWKYK